MEITFNLKDAKALVPFGRLMNVKDAFKLKEIEFTDKEIEQAVNELKSKHFSFKDDPLFSQGMTEMKNLMKFKKVDISDSIKKTAKNTLLQETYYRETCHNLSESLKEDIVSVGQEVMDNPNVKKLKEKLLKLKEINSSI